MGVGTGPADGTAYESATSSYPVAVTWAEKKL